MSPDRSNIFETPRKRRVPRNYELLYHDLTANLIGVGAPVVAAMYALEPWRRFLRTVSENPEASLPSLALFAFNVACAGAFLVAGQESRKRAYEIMGVRPKQQKQT